MVVSKEERRNICEFRQPGRNCPLDNKDADPTTFCEAYKRQDSYICSASAMENDPVDE